MTGEVGRYAQALDALFRRHHLELVQPQIRFRGHMSLVSRERCAPFLTKGMRRQLAGFDRVAGPAAGWKESEPERVASGLGALLTPAVTLIRDLRALIADAAHAPRIPWGA